jgi:hypothetical protein
VRRGRTRGEADGEDDHAQQRKKRQRRGIPDDALDAPAAHQLIV